jgi:hypothetical protein
MHNPQIGMQSVLPPSYKRFVLLLAASKGGTGKSTLGVNLAVAAHYSGLKTVIFDTDLDGDAGQQSCVHWAKARDPKLAGPIVRRVNLARIAEAVAWAEGNGFEFIVMDTAGRDMLGMMRAVDLADFMLTPSQPSPLDLKATEPIRRLWGVSSTPGSIVLNLIIRENLPRTQYYVDRSSTKYMARGRELKFSICCLEDYKWVLVGLASPARIRATHCVTEGAEWSKAHTWKCVAGNLKVRISVLTPLRSCQN